MIIQTELGWGRMGDEINKQIVLRSRPEGTPSASDFELKDASIPEPAAGEFLCRNLYLSLDPYMRGQMSGRHISGVINPGELMRGETIGEVLQSNDPDFSKGDLVAFQGGWQQYAVSRAEDARKIDPRIEPPSLALGIFGMPGLTAFAGTAYLAEPKEGDVLVVSSASGAVGSMVGQIGRIKGCRVIGIAGSDEKCNWVTDKAGFDACINYKTEDLPEALDRLCPDGIDIYFDNVGGDTLEAVIWRLAIGARVVLCGLMSQYNLSEMPPGPNPGAIIRARATVRGLVVYDHEDKRAEFVENALGWIADDKIAYNEEVTEGIENAPEAFERLMSGRNFGKTIIKIA